MTKNNSIRTCCPSRVAIAARVGPVAAADRVGPVPFRSVPSRNLCNHKAKAGKMTERDEERVSPVPSLTIARHVAFGSRRIAPAARRWPKCNIGASDDVPLRCWGRSYVYGDENLPEQYYGAMAVLTQFLIHPLLSMARLIL